MHSIEVTPGPYQTHEARWAVAHQAVNVLKRTLNGRLAAVYLFGSVARNEDNGPEPDIDLLATHCGPVLIQDDEVERCALEALHQAGVATGDPRGPKEENAGRVSLLVVAHEEFRYPNAVDHLLYERNRPNCLLTIRSEGILLYSQN